MSCCSATDEAIGRFATKKQRIFYQRLITYLEEFYLYEYGRRYGGTDFEKEAFLLSALDQFCEEFQ